MAGLRTNPSYLLYKSVMRIAAPLIRSYVRRRYKHDPLRYRVEEKFGVKKEDKFRDDSGVIWIHGASIGECMSSLSIVNQLLSQPATNNSCGKLRNCNSSSTSERHRFQPHAEVRVLVTTGTIGARTVMDRILPQGAICRYVPVDLPCAVDAFLDHWKPTAALFMESELWPNLIVETHRRKVPLAMLNGRISRRSFGRWMGGTPSPPLPPHPPSITSTPPDPGVRSPTDLIQRELPWWPGRSVAAGLLSCFSLVLAQSDADAARLRVLGAQRAKCVGDLKSVAAVQHPVGDGKMRRDDTESALGHSQEPWVWVALSTHPGEEEIVLEAHARLLLRSTRENHGQPMKPLVKPPPDQVQGQGQAQLITLLIPRHAERGSEIRRTLLHEWEARGWGRRLGPLRIVLRSEQAAAAAAAAAAAVGTGGGHTATRGGEFTPPPPPHSAAGGRPWTPLEEGLGLDLDLMLNPGNGREQQQQQGGEGSSQQPQGGRGGVSSSGGGGYGGSMVYVADTLGEIELFCGLAPVALVAGSLIPRPGLGGHNVLEPLKAGCCVLHGPHMSSFEASLHALRELYAANTDTTKPSSSSSSSSSSTSSSPLSPPPPLSPPSSRHLQCATTNTIPPPLPPPPLGASGSQVAAGKHPSGTSGEHGALIGGGGVSPLAVVRNAPDIVEAVAVRLEQPRATMRAGFAGEAAATALGRGVMSRVWSELDRHVFGCTNGRGFISSPPAPIPTQEQ